MKSVFAVLAMALVLVFALSTVVSAGIIRGEDFDVPGNGPPGDDEDHPWGGDRIVGGGGGSADDKYVRSTGLTGNLTIDLLLDRFIGSFYRGGTGATATTGSSQDRSILNGREDELRQGSASAALMCSRVWEVEKR